MGCDCDCRRADGRPLLRTRDAALELNALAAIEARLHRLTGEYDRRFGDPRAAATAAAGAKGAGGARRQQREELGKRGALHLSAAEKTEREVSNVRTPAPLCALLCC